MSLFNNKDFIDTEVDSEEELGIDYLDGDNSEFEPTSEIQTVVTPLNNGPSNISHRKASAATIKQYAPMGVAFIDFHMVDGSRYRIMITKKEGRNV